MEQRPSRARARSGRIGPYSRVALWSLDVISVASRDSSGHELTDREASKVALKGDTARDMCSTKPRAFLVDVRVTWA